jgi:F-type H+-transporting ATPase subunit alpha
MDENHPHISNSIEQSLDLDQKTMEQLNEAVTKFKSDFKLRYQI